MQLITFQYNPFMHWTLTDSVVNTASLNNLRTNEAHIYFQASQVS
jgi:hypothetical protein